MADGCQLAGSQLRLPAAHALIRPFHFSPKDDAYELLMRTVIGLAAIEEGVAIIGLECMRNHCTAPKTFAFEVAAQSLR